MNILVNGLKNYKIDKNLSKLEGVRINKNKIIYNYSKIMRR